jgi:hypothetical protein
LFPSTSTGLLGAAGAQGKAAQKQKHNIGPVFSQGEKKSAGVGRCCGCYVHKARCALYLLKLRSV